jgi:imidazoleglycerol-phosphate dehydratase
MSGEIPFVSAHYRSTRETDIAAEVRRGTGKACVETSDRFLNHMIQTLAHYSWLDIDLRGGGDLRHHLVEDVAIVIGQSIAALTHPMITRFGAYTIPMDDALVQVALDLGGRSYYRGPLPSVLYDHWMRSFADNAHGTLHVRVLRGRDRHHVIEAAFKALGLALRTAVSELTAINSTKGVVSLG